MKSIKKANRIVYLVIIAALSLTLVLSFGCGKYEAPAPVYDQGEESMVPPVPAPAPAPGNFGSFFGGSDEKGTVVTAPAPAPVPAPTPVPAEDGTQIDRLIVRNGDIVLVVEDVAQSIATITELTDNLGGYVVSSNSWRDGERTMGSISIRVPVETFEGALGALRSLAVEVNSEQTYGKDVTEEYVDLDAQLTTLQATEAKLLELLGRTGEVKDILEVQRELTNVQREIAQLKGRMQYLERTAAMSLINVSLQQSKLDVEFNATTRTTKAGEEIRFYASFAGGFPPYSYEWDFGDGETSTAESPRHAYKKAGLYTVTLKVTDDKGYEDEYTREDYIEILPGWNPGNTVSSAWAGLVSIGHFALDVLIWLVYLIPVWIVAGVILYFAWWRRRRKNK